MTEAAATNKAGEKEVPHLADPRPRSVEVSLEWPVEHDGVTVDKIVVRRATGREVEQFIRAVMSAKEGEPAPKPPFLDCPIEVYDQLDDDDRLRLEEAMLPFLPRRLRMEAGLTLASAESSPAE